MSDRLYVFIRCCEASRRTVFDAVPLEAEPLPDFFAFDFTAPHSRRLQGIPESRECPETASRSQRRAGPLAPSRRRCAPGLRPPTERACTLRASGSFLLKPYSVESCPPHRPSRRP